MNKKNSLLIASFFAFVGATGFEPATAWSQTRSATGLRYTPYRKTFVVLRLQRYNYKLNYAKFSLTFYDTKINKYLF